MHHVASENILSRWAQDVQNESMIRLDAHVYQLKTVQKVFFHPYALSGLSEASVPTAFARC